MITLNALTKKFGSTVAVDQVSLEIADGEIFGLIGPDGAGKTTTLRVISTAMLPTSGSATVNGLDVIRESEAVKQLIGYMPQRFALYRDLTVIENLDFFADMFGAPRAGRPEQIDRLLGFARLAEMKARRAANLSGGMQKKLALAATLMHRPQVLLLDEPTTGVDPVSRREFWDLITQVHLGDRAGAIGAVSSRGRAPAGQGNGRVTIVISTPYLDEAERCTRVGLMHRGELIACDTPNALRAGLAVTAFEGETEQPMRARSIAAGLPGVQHATMHGETLRLLLDRPDREAELQTAWQAEGVAVRELHVARPRLEDAFVLMLGQRGVEG